MTVKMNSTMVKPSRLDPGLYMSEDGQQLVFLRHTYSKFRQSGTAFGYYQGIYANYHPMLPTAYYPTSCKAEKFRERYPLGVSQLVVDTDAARTTKIEAGKLYTDGSSVVFVMDIDHLWGKGGARTLTVFPMASRPQSTRRCPTSWSAFVGSSMLPAWK
jgi:hypothetical protein